jgi:hypothetical protein
MRRYFMLIPEAVQLVLHAASIGELNSIYVLDMGEPIRLVDVARDLIRLSGFRPDDVPITFIGLRPGEKLDEELVGNDEIAGPSKVKSVMQVRPRHAPQAPRLWAQIGELEKAALLGDAGAVIAQLRAIVPQFGSATAPVSVPVAEATMRESIERAPRSAPAEAVLTCGACGSEDMRRSRVSGLLEALRHRLTAKRPHRCYVCGWRGWIDGVVMPRTANIVVAPLPDLSRLDAAFRTTTLKPSPPLMPMLSGLAPLPLGQTETMAIDGVAGR